MDTLFDVINIIDTAILYSQNISYSTLEKKREAIQAQHDVVKQIPKKIYNNNKKYDKDIKYAEIEKNLKKFPDRSTQGLEGTNLRDALFNRGQRIRIYLSFFINKFAGGETKPRSDDLTNLEKKYKKQPFLGRALQMQRLLLLWPLLAQAILGTCPLRLLLTYNGLPTKVISYLQY